MHGRKINSGRFLVAAAHRWSGVPPAETSPGEWVDGRFFCPGDFYERESPSNLWERPLHAVGPREHLMLRALHTVYRSVPGAADLYRQRSGRRLASASHRRPDPRNTRTMRHTIPMSRNPIGKNPLGISVLIDVIQRPVWSRGGPCDAKGEPNSKKPLKAKAKYGVYFVDFF